MRAPAKVTRSARADLASTLVRAVWAVAVRAAVAHPVAASRVSAVALAMPAPAAAVVCPGSACNREEAAWAWAAEPATPACVGRVAAPDSLAVTLAPRAPHARRPEPIAATGYAPGVATWVWPVALARARARAAPPIPSAMAACAFPAERLAMPVVRAINAQALAAATTVHASPRTRPAVPAPEPARQARARRAVTAGRPAAGPAATTASRARTDRAPRAATPVRHAARPADRRRLARLVPCARAVGLTACAPAAAVLAMSVAPATCAPMAAARAVAALP